MRTGPDVNKKFKYYGDKSKTHVIIEIRTGKVPSLQPLMLHTSIPCPRSSIRQWHEMHIVQHRNGQKPSNDLESIFGFQTPGENVKHRAEEENGEIESREIMMQEKLSGHQVEGEVMESPAHKEESTEFVVSHVIC